MGSKLTRQRSLDLDTKLSRRRRQRSEAAADGDRSGGGSGRDLLFTSLMLKSDKLPGMLRRSNPCPYVRRVAWIRDIQRLLREQKTEQAAEVLRLLRKVRPAVRRRAGHGAVRVVGLHIQTWCCARRCAVCAVMRREKKKKKFCNIVYFQRIFLTI